MSAAPFPWARAMQIGLGVLRLAPREFWNMTPREFAAALHGLYGEPATPLTRGELDALMARFPDFRTAPHPEEHRRLALRDGACAPPQGGAAGRLEG